MFDGWKEVEPLREKHKTQDTMDKEEQGSGYKTWNETISKPK